MREIKCQYCGRVYEINGERDCCPNCGSFNEFQEQNQEKIIYVKSGDGTDSKKSKIKPFIFGIISAPIILIFIAFMIGFVGAIIEDDENKETKTEVVIKTEKIDIGSGEQLILADGTTYYYYFDAYLDYDDVDYDKYYEYKGSYDECLELSKTMSKYQFGNFRTTLSLNGKITANNTTIYIDSIEMDIYGFDCDSYLNISMESLGNGIEPKEFEMYLVNSKNRHRVKADSYGVSYQDGVTEEEDLFTHKFSGKTYWSFSNFNGDKYDSLEIVVDGKTFSCDLAYDNNDSTVAFYGIK